MPVLPPEAPERHRRFVKRPRSFGKTFLWVMVVHLVVLGLLLFFHVPESHPPGQTQLMEMVAMPSTASSPPTHHVPLPQPTPPPPQVETPPPPSSPAPAPTPQATPRPVVVTPPTPVTPPPSTAPSSFVIPPTPAAKPVIKLVKPIKTTTSTTPPHPTTPAPKVAKEKPAHKIQVNLNLTERPENQSKTSTPTTVRPTTSSRENSDAPPVDSHEIADKLAKELDNSGSTQSIGKVAVSSSGGSPGRFAEFYQLIRQQMYDVWAPPPELVGFKKGTEVQIQVAADGTILDAKVTGSSGNSRFDACALAAALRVGKLREPRPEGCPEFITVNFRLT